MRSQNWFSTKIRMVCLIEPNGAQRYMDSVFVFQSEDFDVAFRRALDVGRGQEKEYLNADGKRVKWRLKEIISLDILEVESLDGVEGYSEPVNLNDTEAIPFDADLHPEASRPTQTV